MAAVEEVQVPLRSEEAPPKEDVAHDRDPRDDGEDRNEDHGHRQQQQQRRRRSNAFRNIPRGKPDNNKEKTGSRGSEGEPKRKGGRPRTPSESSVAGKGRRRTARRRTTSEASGASESSELPPLRKLRDAILEKYEKKGLNLLNSFVKNKLDLAKFANNNAFLTRCNVMQVVPAKYRLFNSNIKNTKQVIRTLDRFSVLIMQSDMRYHRTRKNQVTKLLETKEQQMKELFSEDAYEEIIKYVSETYELRFTRLREQQVKMFEALLKEYGIPIRDKDDAKKEHDDDAKQDTKGEEGEEDKEKDEKEKDEKEEKEPKEETEAEAKEEGDEGDKEEFDDAREDGDDE